MELRRFVSRECSEIAEKTKGLAIEKHLVAPALGGCDFRYKNLNSIPLMKSAADRGYRYLELDVRLTNDGQLACVNGWGPATEKALGITIPEKGLMMGEFLQKSYYGRFPTSSFDEAILAFSNLQKEFPGIKLIVDAGRPETDQLDNFYGQIVEVLQKYCENPKTILIRLPRERDVKKFKEFKYHCKIVYSLPAAEEQQQKAIDFCKKKKIRMLSVSDRVWTPELQEYLKNQEFQTLILSYTKTGDVLTAISAGADLVASHYYDVDYIQQLLF
jgi:glycerophosphoryl diester phosphodiesterase